MFLAEKQILKPNDVSVFSALSINGRLFACPRDQLNSLVRDEGFITLYSLHTVDTCCVCLFALNKVRHFYICVPQTPLPDQEGPSAGSMSTFELMSSKDLAYQMTLYDWELFSCMHEVIHTNKGTRRKTVSKAASPKHLPPRLPSTNCSTTRSAGRTSGEPRPIWTCSCAGSTRFSCGWSLRSASVVSSVRESSSSRSSSR